MRQAALSLFFLAVSFPVFAAQTIVTNESSPNEPPKHEILFSLTGGYYPTYWPDITNGGLNQGFSIGYNYTLFENLQIGIVGGYGISSSFGSNTTALTLLVGPTLSIPLGMGFKNAFFVSLGVGVEYRSNPDLDEYSTVPVLSALLGKRFQILPHLVYRPTIGLFREGENNHLALNPLALSVVF